MMSDEIRRLRKSSGLNQVSFADKMDVSQSTVASWENGTRRPDIDTLCKIANLFRVSVDDVLGRESEHNADKDLSLSATESQLISIFRELNSKGQDALLRQAHYLSSDPDMKKGSVSSTATA